MCVSVVVGLQGLSLGVQGAPRLHPSFLEKASFPVEEAGFSNGRELRKLIK